MTRMAIAAVLAKQPLMEACHGRVVEIQAHQVVAPAKAVARVVDSRTMVSRAILELAETSATHGGST